MGNDNELDKATQRLNTALQSIEDAVASKRHNDLTVESLEERVESLEANLDAERQKKDKLASANEEVSDRIETVKNTINEILEGK